MLKYLFHVHLLSTYHLLSIVPGAENKLMNKSLSQL